MTDKNSSEPIVALKPLSVVLSINDQFAAPCGVVIASACAACSNPHLLRFHVYSTDLSEASRRMLTALAEHPEPP